MIQTQRQARALVSTRQHGPPQNGGAPSEHQAPTIWKIAALPGKKSRPNPAFLLVTALSFCAPEGTRTPNLLIRSPNQGKTRYAEATLPERALSVSAVQTETSSFPLVRAVHRVGQRRGYPARRLQCWNCSVRPRQVPNIRAPSEHRAIPLQPFRPCPGQHPEVTSQVRKSPRPPVQ
jgi:hypothetical protein